MTDKQSEAAASELRSPRITELSWGRVEVEGVAEPLRDAKLFPGGAREWDWTESGTSHSPGIQPADVVELVEAGSTTIVLATGVFGRLQVASDTLTLLRERNIQVETLRTKQAVERYNELAQSEPVGALIHSTC